MQEQLSAQHTDLAELNKINEQSQLEFAIVKEELAQKNESLEQLKDKIVQMSIEADQSKEPFEQAKEKHEKELQQLRDVIQVLTTQLNYKP